MTPSPVRGGAFLDLILTLFFPVQYVVPPRRRSTAEAIQILVCHAFGDAGSPYLIGVVRIQKAGFFLFTDNARLILLKDHGIFIVFESHFAKHRPVIQNFVALVV